MWQRGCGGTEEKDRERRRERERGRDGERDEGGIEATRRGTKRCGDGTRDTDEDTTHTATILTGKRPPGHATLSGQASVSRSTGDALVIETVRTEGTRTGRGGRRADRTFALGRAELGFTTTASNPLLSLGPGTEASIPRRRLRASPDPPFPTQAFSQRIGSKPAGAARRDAMAPCTNAPATESNPFDFRENPRASAGPSRIHAPPFSLQPRELGTPGVGTCFAISVNGAVRPLSHAALRDAGRALFDDVYGAASINRSRSVNYGEGEWGLGWTVFG